MTTKILRRCSLAGTLTLIACSNPTDPYGPPANISPESPTSFEFSAGVQGADSVAVRIVDSRGRGVPNVQIAWTSGSSDVARPQDVFSVTSSDGRAATLLMVGTRSGTTSVSANLLIDGQPAAFHFDVVVEPGPAVRIELDTMKLVLPHPSNRTVGVRAFDQYGNLLPSTSVVWTSSRNAIAAVSGVGAITSQEVGAAIVTARAGDATAFLTVWVIPRVLSACEWNTGRVCSTWTLNANGIYDVVADDGGTAWHEIVNMTEAGLIEVKREDWGKNKDFTGWYTGTINGKAAAGQVRWTQYGFSWSGTWSASW